MTSNSEICDLVKACAIRLRINSIKATEASASGHPTSCSSLAEIMAVLFSKEMCYKVSDPRCPSSDRFVLSKGHAAPVLYAAWADVGLFPESDLLNLRKISSDLEGHPTPRLNFIDVATGSLGQGLSNAVGMAYTGKYIDKANYRVYCIIGDGESAEGSIWEAISFSSYYKLDNLVIIFDVNRLGQSDPTQLQHDLETYRSRTAAFGCHSIIVDGHDVNDLLNAFSVARTIKEKPVALICKTFKGYDFPEISDTDNWHGKPLGKFAAATIDHLEKQLASKPKKKLKPTSPKEDCSAIKLLTTIKFTSPPNYKVGEEVSTRAAYGNALARLGKEHSRLIALDGDTKNSTFSLKLKDVKPEQFIECFIAEQNLIGVAIGCAVRERTVPFVSTFAAFLTRGFDQIRMGAVSQTNCNFAGTHVGVSIGEDGPSQMGLEDIAMFRSVIGSTIFYPSDAVSTEYAVELASNTRGICFIRLGRPNQPVIYNSTESFVIGKGKVVRTAGPTNDHITVVAAGITLNESMKAADILSKAGINLRVIDPFTIKPMDAELLAKAVKETCNKVIVVEDHVPEGGIGDAVSAALSSLSVEHVVHRMGVREIPRSGKPNELIARYEIDSNAIVKKIKSVLGK